MVERDFQNPARAFSLVHVEMWPTFGQCDHGYERPFKRVRYVRLLASVIGSTYNLLVSGGDWGRLAQRLERLVHTEEVRGSNPLSPTIGPNLGWYRP